MSANYSKAGFISLGLSIFLHITLIALPIFLHFEPKVQKQEIVSIINATIITSKDNIGDEKDLEKSRHDLKPSETRDKSQESPVHKPAIDEIESQNQSTPEPKKPAPKEKAELESEFSKIVKELRPVEKTNKVKPSFKIESEKTKVEQTIKKPSDEIRPKLPLEKLSLPQVEKKTSSNPDDILSFKKNLKKASKVLSIDEDSSPDGGAESSATLANLIRSRIIPCWTIKESYAQTRRIRIKVIVQFDKNGFVQTVRPTESGSFEDAFYRSVTESAIDAVLKCSPIIDLPKDRYSEWKEVELIFDPVNILR